MSCDALILGSKPEAIVPPASYVYAANTSGFFYRDSITKKSVLKVIACAAKLYTVDCVPTENLEKLILSSAKEIIITAYDKRQACFDHLYSCNPDKNIVVLTASERRNIFNQLLRFSILPAPFFLLKLSDYQAVKLNYMLLKTIVMQKLKDQNIDVPAIFRPSTGAFALAYAIKDCPQAERYIISGIGLSKRNEYPGMVGADKVNRFENHVMADKILFSRLATRYPLYTTDLELADMTGIPVFQTK